MDVMNIQALIAQGLITDVASIDPNTAYVAVGVYQPGNRQSGPAGIYNPCWRRVYWRIYSYYKITSNRFTNLCR